MSWSKSLTGFADEAEKALTKRQKDIAAYFLQQVIVTSPVMDGTYRGNHRVTVDGITLDYDLDLQDAGGQMTLMSGMQQIGTVSQPFGSITIQNNLPYGERIENGWSMQAASGVYSVALNSTVEKFK